jgi:hypothetical protein
VRLFPFSDIFCFALNYKLIAILRSGFVLHLCGHRTYAAMGTFLLENGLTQTYLCENEIFRYLHDSVIR